MESPFSTLVFVFFGFGISFCAIFVQSQSEDGATNVASLPPEHPPPPPPEHPPPPPPEHPPPPPPEHPPPPPPEHPPPPPPEHPPPPPPEHPPPPHHSPNQLNYRNKPSRSPPPRRPNYRPPPPLPPPSHSNNVNTGKKVGLLFVGLASILQIGVVGFLVFKRRQLLKLDDRY